MIDQKSILFSWILSAFLSIPLSQAAKDNQTDTQLRSKEDLRIMFYNVENLFDTFDDPAVDDEEFLPGGAKSWTYYRYKEKLNNLAKTIIAVGGWEPPDLIGLSEIENFQVLLDLTNETPLKSFGYQIIHENSMDSRGIDVALLYLPEKVKKLKHKSIRFGEGVGLQTRDILFTTFCFQDKDTFSIYVNHWSSRYGGKEFTREKRMLAADVLKSHVTGELLNNPSSKLIILGDFNDEPDDESLHNILGAKSAKKASVSHGSQNEFLELYNLSFPDFQQGRGTLTYKEIDYTWFLFDQIIVTGTLLEGVGLKVKGQQCHIFSADWLLENGRPKRSYQGPIYKGGFSDHLPIFVDLYYKE